MSFLDLLLIFPAVLALMVAFEKFAWIIPAVPAASALGVVFSFFSPLGWHQEIEWFLFGMTFGLDAIGRYFLILTTLVWFFASLYALVSIEERKQSFWFWFLVTYLGNIGICVAGDPLGFYLFFSLMSFGAFGIIHHPQTPEAKEAAFVYIKYAVVGEIVLFVGIILNISIEKEIDFAMFTSQNSSFGTFLLLVGFGIKAGVFMLHSWLPYAHANAPASVSAVLSGVMLKAGILGWLRFVPLGSGVEPFFGEMLVYLGFAAIFGGVYGVFLDRLKALLAYSSISQMGYLSVLYGYALQTGRADEGIIAALVLFVLHHGFNKAGLFLLSKEILSKGLGGVHLFFLLFFGLSLIGLPFTSGAAAKELLDATQMPLLFGAGSFVSTLLMVRFFLLARKIKPKEAQKSGLVWIFLGLACCVVSLGIVFGFYVGSWGTPLFFVLGVGFFIVLERLNLALRILPEGDFFVLFKKIADIKSGVATGKMQHAKGFAWHKYAAIVEQKFREERAVFFFVLAFLALGITVIVS